MPEVVEFLIEASRVYDDQDLPPERRGVSIVLKEEPDYPECVTLTARYMNVFNALQYVCELSNHAFSIHGETVVVGPRLTVEQQIELRLREIVVPEVNFKNATMPEVAVFLVEASREYDDQNLPPEQRGVEFAMQVKPDFLGGGAVTLTAKNMPLFDVLQVACEKTKHAFSIYGSIVIIESVGKSGVNPSPKDHAFSNDELEDLLF